MVLTGELLVGDVLCVVAVVLGKEAAEPGVRNAEGHSCGGRAIRGGRSQRGEVGSFCYSVPQELVIRSSWALPDLVDYIRSLLGEDLSAVVGVTNIRFANQARRSEVAERRSRDDTVNLSVQSIASLDDSCVDRIELALCWCVALVGFDGEWPLLGTVFGMS